MTVAHEAGPALAAARVYRPLAAAIALALAGPLLATGYPPLVDYPNHLARAFILRHYGDVPSFAADYALALRPIPNVAIDVVVAALQYVLPPLAAGRVFLAVVVLLWCLGCHLLGRAVHGRATLLALPCMLLAYHGPFQYGFVNYSLGLGLYLIAAAVWLTRRRRWTAGGVALASALAAVAYLSHLSAYALLGVTAVAVTVYDLARRRTTLANAVLGGVPFVPPLLLFAAFMRGGGRVGRVEWNTLAGKAVAAFSLVRGYDLRLDAALAGVAALVGVAALAVARRRGRLGAHGAPLAAGLTLVALFLACPKDLFTSGGADVRVVPAAAVLLVLALRLELPRRAGAALLAGVLLVLGARAAGIVAAWASLDAQTARAVALLDRMPEGARLLPLFAPRDGVDRAKRDRTLEHAPYYAVITRRAYVPLLFAVPSQQPVVARRHQWGTVLAGQLFERRLDEFSHVWAYGQPPTVRARLERCCALVASDVGVELWEVRRP